MQTNTTPSPTVAHTQGSTPPYRVGQDSNLGCEEPKAHRAAAASREVGDHRSQHCGRARKKNNHTVVCGTDTIHNILVYPTPFCVPVRVCIYAFKDPPCMCVYTCVCTVLVFPLKTLRTRARVGVDVMRPVRYLDCVLIRTRTPHNVHTYHTLSHACARTNMYTVIISRALRS